MRAMDAGETSANCATEQKGEAGASRFSAMRGLMVAVPVAAGIWALAAAIIRMMAR